MPRKLLLAVSLTLLLPISDNVAAQASSKPPVAAKADKPFNIGIVLYTIGKAAGTLDGRRIAAHHFPANREVKHPPEFIKILPLGRC